jgi:hypothetical protein
MRKGDGGDGGNKPGEYERSTRIILKGAVLFALFDLFPLILPF